MSPSRRKRSKEDTRRPLAVHLRELRTRVILIAGGLALGAVAGWLLFDPVFETLQAPLLEAAEASGGVVSVNFDGLASAFDVRIKVSLFLAVLLTVPWWLYQLWAFIAPGLTGREKKWTLGFVAVASPLFMLGVLAGWFVIPRAVAILTGFVPEDSTNLINAQTYLTFVMQMLLAFGLAFMFPVIMVMLSWMGVVKWRTWLRGWRWALVIIAIAAAVMTPTPDATTMMLLAVPMVILYFAGVGVASLRRPKTLEEIESEEHAA